MIPTFALAMAITDFGESAVVLATTFAVSTCFWLSHQRRMAVLWLLVVGGCSATMIVLKLGFLTCGDLVLNGMVHTPSGHSSMGALFYGVVALTIGRLAAPADRYRLLMLGAAFLLALMIGASRIYIHAHSPQEVVIGLLVGFSWLGVFAWLLRYTDTTMRIPPIAVLCLLALLYAGLLTLAMIGEHMSFESRLFYISRLLQLRWGVCVR